MFQRSPLWWKEMLGLEAIVYRWLTVCLIVLAWTSAATLAHRPDISGTNPQESEDEFERPLTPEQAREGWIALFDGHSLFGWRNESSANWRVEGGCLVADAGTVGLLRTTSQFDDFELSVHFKASEKTNSGVFIRTSPQPIDPTVDCYEINIAPADNPYPTGSVVGRKKASSIERDDEPFDQMTIIADGGMISVMINGVEVCEVDDPRPLGRGYIGLQFNSGPICFRDVFLRPLNQKSLIGKGGLDAWDPDNELAGRFEWSEENLLRGFGGRGQLESRERFADFILQTTARTWGEDQNSGIFMRCIPGEIMNGYESQIDHEVTGGDPTKPVDHGTGGIFRRQPARRVMTSENQWFSKTIAACGPHFSVWVDGYQVVDWSDRRDTDPNPRRGLRLESGTIILQLHDEDSEVHFRSIRAKELAPRGR